MAALEAGFAVYIDEAGDPGFRFLHADGSKGSSEWFIVSAAIVRTESHEAFLDEVAYQSRTFGVGQAGRLHFKEMEHYRRIAWLENLQSCPILATSVITHKHSL